MRRVGIVVLALLAALGIAAAVFWDRPALRAIRCEMGGDVPFGGRCLHPSSSQVSIRGGEDLARLAELPLLDTLHIDAGALGDGSQDFPVLPGLRIVFVEGGPASSDVDLGRLSGLAPVETLSLEGVSVPDPAPIAALSPETLVLKSVRMPALPVLPGLRGLQMRKTPVPDLSALAGSASLEWMTASGAPLPPLGPLTGATSLRQLTLAGHEGRGLEDLSTLSGLDGLRDLTLHGGGLSDLAPLMGLDGLESLRLGEVRDIDLSPLAALPALSDLSFSNAADLDLRALSAVPALERLSLSGSGAGDGLSSGTLTELSIHATPSAPGALGALPSLTHLRLNGVESVDLTALPDLPRLRSIEIENADAVRLSGLRGVPGLQRLVLTYVRAPDLSALDGHPGLETLIVRFWHPERTPSLASLPALTQLDLSGPVPEDLAALSGRPLVTLALDLRDGETIDAALPLDALRRLDIRDGLLTRDLVARLPALEWAAGRGEDGKPVSLRDRAGIEAWLAEGG